MIKPLSLLALAVALALAHQALGQERGGVRVGGDLRQQAVVGQSVTIASGAGARAATTVGSVGAQVPGSLDIFGSVHESTTGAEIVVSTGRVIDLGRSGGAPACVEIGSVGRAPGC